jgi:hypothetical protein
MSQERAWKERNSPHFFASMDIIDLSRAIAAYRQKSAIGREADAADGTVELFNICFRLAAYTYFSCERL